MPFTPFHFGPGAALKAAIPKQFSFALFCFTQCVTDLESGYHLARGEYPVHRLFHTYAGATVVGLCCAVAGRPVCKAGLSVWRAIPRAPFKALIGDGAGISWSSAFLTSMISTYSHVFLDSIMHGDLAPFSPFSVSNPFLHLISVQSLHLLCVTLGVIGTAILLRRRNRRLDV
ncbi:MAG TPA: DUF4184 domain-containing protein [Candidatus Angelobacter sp.]|nr:DUF4184 domain-containing protein [Candidatus Angelobacter sp.]